MTRLFAFGVAGVLLGAFVLAQLRPKSTAGPSGAMPEQAQLARPTLPQVIVDTQFEPPAGPMITVPAGGDFQAALNAAKPGTVIVLQAGATYTGNFTLPSKSGSGWIYIQSSALSRLPPAGTRVSPAHASLMPRIATPNAFPAIQTAAGAHHVRLIGLEITTTPDAVFNVVDLSKSNNIVLDRCFIHGTAVGNSRHGVIMNGVALAVIDSHVSDFHHTSEDATAIIAWDGPGPLKIANSYLEGAAENVLLGGQDPSRAGNTPSDIEIRGNHFAKPLSWRGAQWIVKNLFELKNARRVLVDGNVFENNWTGADQAGFAILFTPRNQNGRAPYSSVQDVTFTNNIVRRSTAGFNVLGWDNVRTNDEKTQRILIQNNLLADIGIFPDTRYQGQFTGMLLMVSDGPANVIVDHNTFLQRGVMIYANIFKASRWPAWGFVFTNNITLGVQGMKGAGTDTPLRTLATYFPNAVFARNAVVGGTDSEYPADNFFPATVDLVGFVNMEGGDYRLAAGSPHKLAGSDGKDVGADLDTLLAAVTRWQHPPALP